MTFVGAACRGAGVLTSLVALLTFPDQFLPPRCRVGPILWLAPIYGGVDAGGVCDSGVMVWRRAIALVAGGADFRISPGAKDGSSWDYPPPDFVRGSAGRDHSFGACLAGSGRRGRVDHRRLSFWP